MKKRILFFIFLFITLFFVNIDVYADNFGEDSLQVTCIYANGKAVVRGYDSFSKGSYASLSDYPTINYYKLNYEVNDYSLFNSDESDTKNSDVASKMKYDCPEYIIRYLYDIYDEVYDDRVTNITYSYETGKEAIIVSDTRNGWQQFWGTKKNQVARIIDPSTGKMYTSSTAVKGDVKDVNTCSTCYTKIPLVAERISWMSGVDDLKVCNYVHKSSQASGNDQYIELSVTPTMIIDAYSSKSLLYLSSNDDTTTVTNSSIATSVKNNSCQNDYPCLCVKLSTKEQNSAEGTTEYIFSAPRHEITVGNKTGDTCSCSSGYVSYSYTSTGDPNSSGTSDVIQVCTAMPETTKVLARVIKWVQILVPIFVIVFTGIDIGKIVVAGNLEEELPKRKKGIIVRCIVMVVFLFLPLIIKVLFSTIFEEGTLGVADINCLFEVELID